MSDATTVREEPDAVIRPDRDIVAAFVPELRAALRAAVANGARELVLDLTNVGMVDSSGIGLLVAAHNTLERNGGRFSVIHASRDILDLFRTMRIHQHFSVAGAEAGR